MKKALSDLAESQAVAGAVGPRAGRGIVGESPPTVSVRRVFCSGGSGGMGRREWRGGRERGRRVRGCEKDGPGIGLVAFCTGRLGEVG